VKVQKNNFFLNLIGTIPFIKKELHKNGQAQNRASPNKHSYQITKYGKKETKI